MTEVPPVPTRVLDLDNFQRTPTGLIISEATSYEDWLAYGEGLKAAEHSLPWWIGDWWAFGEHKYGARKKLTHKDNGWVGPAFQTCMDAAWVCRKFETSRRREVLGFGFHKEVAALDIEEAEEILNQAVFEQWGRKEVRSAANQIKNLNRLVSTQKAEAKPKDTTKAPGRKILDLNVLVEAGEQFGLIYADPPWVYGNQATRAATGNHYEGLTVQQLCDLPIKKLAMKDAQLQLWTTNGFLFECPKIFEAWGFEFRSSYVWVKPQMGIGNYWRNSHEILLTAIRGNAKRFDVHNLMSWGQYPRGKHSAKPTEIRTLIEQAWTSGPRLELFGRKVEPGWTVFGNQFEDDLFNRETEF